MSLHHDEIQNDDAQFEVHVDRDYGADESFEAATEEQALNILDEEIGERDTRRVWVENTATGSVVSEWSR